MYEKRKSAPAAPFFEARAQRTPLLLRKGGPIRPREKSRLTAKFSTSLGTTQPDILKKYQTI